ncbi:MAG: DUF3341 domain-containing protein [Armatimonadetes bacterium]|nr:DUF3341 domain-containing protein [Armatimonadota bacterium]MDE2206822.1 DUF3341 domain-containing protein [Armatimonadota bacterium]
MENTATAQLYGLTAEFRTVEDLAAAARSAYAAGFRKIDAYTPMPNHEVVEALHFDDARVPWGIFIAGIMGGCFGFVMQWWVNVAGEAFKSWARVPGPAGYVLRFLVWDCSFPENVGGRPYFSWVSFIPITFECTILFAALFAVFGCVFGLNGLPRPYHSIFNAPGFDRASSDRFFLCIEANDPNFDRRATWGFLETLNADAIAEVPA